MTSQELKELVKQHFSLTEAQTQTKESFGELKDINGAFTLIFEGEALEVGKEVKVRTTEGQELTAPDGEHELENGDKIRVEGGVVVELMPPSADEEMVEEIPTTEQEQVVNEKMDARTDAEEEGYLDGEADVKSDVVEEVAKAVIEAVKDEIEAMKKEMAEMKTKMAEMEDAPATEKAMPSKMSKDSVKADNPFNKERFEAVMSRIKTKK